MSHWYDSTPKKSRRKRDSNPGSSALEADALPARRSRDGVESGRGERERERDREREREAGEEGGVGGGDGRERERRGMGGGVM